MAYLISPINFITSSWKRNNNTKIDQDMTNRKVISIFSTSRIDFNNKIINFFSYFCIKIQFSLDNIFS